jgi:hypothetical protein
VGEVALAQDEKEDTGTEDRVEYSLGPISHVMCVRRWSDVRSISAHTLPANW